MSSKLQGGEFPATATLENWRQYPHSVWGFRNVDRLVRTATIEAGAPSPLSPGRLLDLGRIDFSWHGHRRTVAEALAESHTDGFLLLRHGKVLAEIYNNGDKDSRHIIFSVSKSVTGTLSGILVAEGLLDSEAPVVTYVPEASGSAYSACTVRHVLDMTVAISFNEDYLDPLGDVARYRVAAGWNPPGKTPEREGLHGFVVKLQQSDGRHGERFHYVSPNSDLLGWIVERAGGASYAELLSRFIWQPIGADRPALITLDHLGAPRAAGGICTTLRDLARFGDLMRQRGTIAGKQIVPESWIDDTIENGDGHAWQAGDMTALFPHGRYRSQWYMPGDVPGAFCAIGIHGQWVYIDPAAGMVAVKQSSQPLPVDDNLDHLTYAMFRAIGQHFRL